MIRKELSLLEYYNNWKSIKVPNVSKIDSLHDKIMDARYLLWF